MLKSWKAVVQGTVPHQTDIPWCLLTRDDVYVMGTFRNEPLSSCWIGTPASRVRIKTCSAILINKNQHKCQVMFWMCAGLKSISESVNFQNVKTNWVMHYLLSLSLSWNPNQSEWSPKTHTVLELTLSFFYPRRDMSHPPPLLSPQNAPHIALGPHLRPPFLGMPSALCQAPG